MRPVTSTPPPAPSVGRLSAPPPARGIESPALLDDTTLLERRKPNRVLYGVVGALVLGAAVLLVMLLLPKSGSLVVSVSGPGNRQIDAVQIFVDGKKECETSPCVVNDVEVGARIVKVSAPGYATPAAQPVKVESGDEAIVEIKMVPGSDGTGIKVTALASGLKLWVDGKEIGPLPQELKELTPGDHRIKVAGSDRLEAYEETVTVGANEIKSVGPVTPKVLLGLAKIAAGQNAADAKVMLVSGSDRRLIPRLPFEVDVKTDKSYKLVATRKGFQTFETPVQFDAGVPEKTFTVELRPESEAAEAPEPVAQVRASTGGGRSGSSRSQSSQSATADGKGKININSIPSSNVLLDGRPLGPTPRTGVSVSAGTHTVMFVHPQHGRKQLSVRVVAGKTATAAVRFP